ncbi:hypothetical protein CUC08_Gglean002245 [Alternaria sp. MG1]|nr:hypothetical protein CUC08_Gglean002245 [Alternaria sp. MG1]
MDDIGLGRAGHFFAIATAHTVPVLLALTPIEWFKGFHIGLAAFKGIVVIAICVTMFYIEEFTGNPPKVYASQGYAATSGSLVHTYIIRTLHAMFMLCPFCFGMQAVSVVAPEMTDEQQVLPRLDKERPADPILPAQKDGLRRPATTALYMALLLLVVIVYLMGGVSQTMDSRSPYQDGSLDAASSIFIQSSEATSESLGFWMKVLFIAFCVATGASYLHLLSRSIYGMSVEYSGQTNGYSNTGDGRIKLGFLWSWLSQKNKFNVPWVSVLVPTPMPVVFLLVKFLGPASTPAVSILKKAP